MWQSGAANLARKISKKDYNNLEPSFLNFVEKGKQYTMFDFMDAEAKEQNSVHLKKFLVILMQ